MVNRLFEDCPLPLIRSVSATTRPPRPGEVDGRDYHFLTPEEFHRRREAGDFLECCEVFGKNFWYGTLQQEVASGLEQGKWVVLEIDVQGTAVVTRYYPAAITIFLRPQDWQELERRLRGRGTESEDKVQLRLEVARSELDCARRYQYEVINQQVADTVAEICRILQASGEPTR